MRYWGAEPQVLFKYTYKFYDPVEGKYLFYEQLSDLEINELRAISVLYIELRKGKRENFFVFFSFSYPLFFCTLFFNAFSIFFSSFSPGVTMTTAQPL